MLAQLDILYEDNHLLVVNKPAGIATMGAESGETVHSLAAGYLKQKYNKPGNVYVGVVSRLDAMTSGVIVLARTSKAASRLVPQFGASGQNTKQHGDSAAVKIYLAAVEGTVDEAGNWSDQVRKDDAAHRMRVVRADADGGQRAELEYVKVGDTPDASIIAVRLKTGRKHQIRSQFADRGHPVIGDRKYGSARKFSQGIALHSWCLQLKHPTRQETCTWYADPPRSWKRFEGLMPGKERIVSMVEMRFGLDLQCRA